VEWDVFCRRSEHEEVFSSFLHAAQASNMLLAVFAQDCSLHIKAPDFCRTQPYLDGKCRCGASATLDRAKESQRDKDRLLLTGKGHARTMECWLRVHQSCNADWSHLMSTSLKFKVPSGYRHFNSKQPFAKHKSPSQCKVVACVQHQSCKSKHTQETAWSTAQSTCFCLTQEALI